MTTVTITAYDEWEGAKRREEAERVRAIEYARNEFLEAVKMKRRAEEMLTTLGEIRAETDGEWQRVSMLVATAVRDYVLQGTGSEPLAPPGPALAAIVNQVLAAEGKQ